jgi:hypothetical protein
LHRPRLIAGRGEQAQSDNVISEARLYPPLAGPPDFDNASQLNILQRRVMEYWVDGVLKHSLYSEVLISLEKRRDDKSVDAPWKYTVEVADVTDSSPLDDRTVRAIYDTTGLLLILGEPGAGKTTTLLDLAHALLERSKGDVKERVPVVLNLSSWKKQPLADWISIELSEKYRVPRKIGRYWLNHDYLLPLLDGLDEIEVSMQPECVTAINVFIEEFQPSGLVVCCRLNEYRWLPKRLKLNGAICIEPLSSEEVSNYLVAGGPKLEALREAVETDPILHELAQTPLMLSIMSLAYQGARGDELATQDGDFAERRKQVFRLYVEQMFQRKGTTSLVFPKEKIIDWLSWLAGRENSQSVFLVEGLQPSWLDGRAKGVAYGIAVILIFGLIGGLLSRLIYGPLYVPIGGLISALFGGFVVGSLNNIALVEIISIKWIKFWGAMILTAIFGLISALISGLGLISALIIGLILGLGMGLQSGLLEFGSPGGLTHRVKVAKASPNQGIKLSLKNSLGMFLSTWLIGALISALYDRLNDGRSLGPSWPSIGPIWTGLLLGIAVGLNRGGQAVVKHYALRLILWLNGYTPFKFVKFLDHCAKLIFLKKVGGGYIFIHGMLLDYFADLTPQSTKAVDGKTRSVGS